MRRCLVAVAVAGMLTVAFTACEPIVAPPTVDSPRNVCNESACDRYDQPSARPSCSGSGRCEVAGNPEYPYVLAISVPEGSFYAPGKTFVLRSQDLRGDLDKCPAPRCFVMPQLVEVNGEYRVASAVAEQIGYVLGAELLPAQAVYFPEIQLDDGTRVDASDVGLPVLPYFGATLAATESTGLRFQTFVPLGPYRREVLPARPFDVAFPPFVRSMNVSVEGFVANAPFFTDRFVVGAGPASLDDPTGSAHTAFVKRSAGLDGFYTYLRDRRTERRLSSLRPLVGNDSAVRLDTLGQNGDDGALRDGIDIVVMPDDRWIGMPTLVDRILAGAGFRLEYPDLPSPVSVTGQLAADGAVSGTVTFVSTRVDVVTPTTSEMIYRTVVRSDGEGRFATVLPPGNYEAYVEPDDAAFAKTRISVSVSATDRNLILRAARRGTVSGRVRIADGRALANADVLWGPAISRLSSSTPWTSPRPGRTRTDADGRYTLALDEGDYDVTVIPTEGTGFPRFVAPRRPVGPNDATLDDLVVVAPTRVSLAMKSPEGQSIVRAVVRAFAFVPSVSSYVEVAQALSDTNGELELLLGPLPK